MARLGVNINPIATMRGVNTMGSPDPLNALVYAEVGGADGIVCRLGEEFGPLTERDIRVLKQAVKTHLNIQIPPTDKMVALMLDVAPDMVTLVPGKKPGSTEGGGLDVLGHAHDIGDLVQSIREKEIVVSLFIEPAIQHVKAAAKVGADYVELLAGPFVQAEDLNERADQKEAIASVALAASKLELGVAVSQGLDYQNVSDIAAISAVEEINVGTAIAARALWVGFENAVRDMAALVR